MDESRLIYLTQDKVTIIDSSNYTYLNRYKWYAHKRNGIFYASRGKWINGKCKVFHMHNTIMKPKQGEIVDHINGNGLDNRKCNLRIVNKSQNGFNSKVSKRNTSGYKGVSWHKGHCKWSCYVIKNGKLIHLGYFDNKIEAALVRDCKMVELYGLYCKLNFPDYI